MSFVFLSEEKAMNAHHIVLPILVVVASAGALLSTAGHPENALQADHHLKSIIQSHTDHQHEFDRHDEVAVEDMLHHAAMHLDAVAAVPGTYVALTDWKPSWELRWMDFQHGDHVVRLYHATDHNHPETRFVVVVDDAEHGAIEAWIPVQ
jgi:hypothetical protein